MTGPLSTHVPASAVVPPVRRPYTAAFRALVALAAVTGIVIDLALGSPGRVLSYFTVQSNLFVAVVFALAARRAWSARPPLPAPLTGAALLYISVTGLVYHLVLAADVSSSSPAASLATQLLHTATPLAALLDWLLLTRPGDLRLRHTPWWLLYPPAYLLYSLARGALLPPGPTARYPYPFLDVDTQGYAAVLGNASVLGLTFCALATLMIGLDRVRPYVRGPENRISPPGPGGLK
ncbi:Pr6Pr family membrane protein [Streptomyces sp. LP05-1]|uniref:Pr6Pr family membrane protein n=1 Tax=Streptomyces pyxinae TaxID=2970734 RepID=A0ABT2CPV4_9ACTN|nr:Pr6Pr family membrane protein [Streptomyces sp. LP05-1]MCS0639291.1 Pr6Pr family membrane protein [Streptomyces sp. LP05-1]